MANAQSRQAEAAAGGVWRSPLLFLGLATLFVLEGTTRNAMFSGSWSTALEILNVGLIYAIVALGVNMQWGYAGLFNVGVVGFFALGGLAPVLISMPPVPGAWAAGGVRMVFALLIGLGTLALAALVWHRMRIRARGLVVTAILIVGLVVYRYVFDPAALAIEANNPAAYGYLGGLKLPVWLAFLVGGIFAAIAAWAIGKVALGLRSDYLAIATLGIGEIIVAVMRNEEWLTRGVKGVSPIPRPWPVGSEVALQSDPSFQARAAAWGLDLTTASTIWVKIGYSLTFALILFAIVTLAEFALNSPWGRMMRAIRDNETAAEAMGKDVTARHLQVFILGSAVIGIAGALFVTKNGLLWPSGYNPLQYTFIVWLMVVVGGSGNNWGAVLGALLMWFVWIKAEVWGPALMGGLTSLMGESVVRQQLVEASAHMRLVMMGLILLLVLRFAPRGLLPER
ncbi:branched-chain amino acid ABC transporter permease [Paracoccus pacificus]|uniref:Branched-chain amino acid ABC transporter permease n=1 Tax=Paracoccus pacificus TaxID=1463598 RepID=A0ABW4R4W2_9RHOB